MSLAVTLPGAAVAETVDIATGPAEPFSFDRLRETAKRLAGEPYAPATLPAADLAVLEAIDYDRHNQIGFRPERTLWADHGGAAKVRFFHPGRYFKEPVEISVVEGYRGVARPSPKRAIAGISTSQESSPPPTMMADER